MFFAKYNFFFDPTWQIPRNSSMLTMIKERESTKTTVRPAAPPRSVREPCAIGTKKVNSPASAARLMWVEQINAVRDHQDQAAFAEVFAYFAPRVKAFLMKSGAAHDVAEECAQDVMATLWHKAHMFDPSKASVSTWIFTIARNRRIDWLRKQRRPEPEELTWGPEPEPEQADALALQQETDKLGKALADLPEKQRMLIRQAYFGELSHSEIAEKTGLPLGTIKSRIRLALERLRHNMN